MGKERGNTQDINFSLKVMHAVCIEDTTTHKSKGTLYKG